MTEAAGHPTQPAPGGARLEWLFLDLNSFFASVEQQVQPALRGQPVIVIPVKSEFTCAIAASYPAKAFGIKTGTPVREARLKCPTVRCVIARHDLYVLYHEAIRQEVGRHLPVTQVASIDELACRLPGDFGRPAAAVRSPAYAGSASNTSTSTSKKRNGAGTTAVKTTIRGS